jgi:hypothetical protein
MGMNEKKLYQELKIRAFSKIPNFQHDRIESLVSSNGMPDLTFSYAGVNGFIELKYLDKSPKLSDTFKLMHPLSALQRYWLQTRGEAGGYCWLLVGTAESLYLMHWNKLHLLNVPLKKFTWGDFEKACEIKINKDELEAVKLCRALVKK